MKILAVETAGKICSVALLEDEKVIQEITVEDGNTHSVKLMPLIDTVLKKSKVTIQEIDLFACDKGPGSFTGIRIGIATIKAFADVTNKKVIGITSLESLAYYENENTMICTMLDAKNENIYYGLFENSDGDYELVENLQFGNIHEVLENLKQKDQTISFIGDAAIHYQEEIKDVLGNRAILREDYQLTATHIGKIAFKKNKEAVTSNELQPTYLRKSNAER